MNGRIMAIWEYPGENIHYLCKEIIKVHSNGSVTIKGYEKCVWIKPIKVIPYDENIVKKLNELNTELKSKKDELNEIYNKKFEDFIGGV